jgi:hypothetical protein
MIDIRITTEPVDTYHAKSGIEIGMADYTFFVDGFLNAIAFFLPFPFFSLPFSSTFFLADLGGRGAIAIFFFVLTFGISFLLEY